MSRLLSICIVIVLLFSSCSRTPPADDGLVSSLVAAKIDQEAKWGCMDAETEALIQHLTENELTADSAIQIALLNNPIIQAIYEDLGIAQANLVEAGLFPNPVFDIEIRYPHVKKLKTNIEYLLVTSLIDILLIPLRTQLAATEFEQTKLRVSNEILNLAFDVRKTFYELVAEQVKVKSIQSSAELSGINSEIALRQHTIGNVNDLHVELAQSKFLEVELELAQSQAEVIRLKEKLNRLLGFCEEACLHLPENITDEMDYQGFDLCALEAVALKERLDLSTARFEIIRLSQMLGLKDWWTYTNFKGGLAGERGADGLHFMGPGFSTELPIFNYGQAARLRLFSELRQAQDRLDALEVQILSEVRTAHKLLMCYLEIINDYKMRLLPLQENILASSEALYNVMGLGVNDLLDKKMQEVRITQNYIEGIKKYLVARVALDQALGGNLFRLLFQQDNL